MLKNVIGLLAGLLFGFGLLISGMTDPVKVQGFLDVFRRMGYFPCFSHGWRLMVAVVGVQLAKRQKNQLDWHIDESCQVKP